MFLGDSIEALVAAHKPKLQKTIALQDALNARFYNMEEAVECLILAAMSGEAMVMIGEPGTAKSRLVRVFCNLTGILPTGADETATQAGGRITKAKPNTRYFEYLLTQFTEPSELFGFYDFAKLQKEGLVRDQTNMMNEAEVVFLDEVFNASSAILNALLTFMNERKFHDRGNIWNSNLRLLVSASNRPPRDEELDAVYDRFLLRCPVKNVEEDPAKMSLMMKTAWSETYDKERAEAQINENNFNGFFDDMDALRNDITARTSKAQLQIDETHKVFHWLTDITYTLRHYELSLMTNRRLVKFAMIILCSKLLALVRGTNNNPEIVEDDLDVIIRYSLDLHDAEDNDLASLKAKIRQP